MSTLLQLPAELLEIILAHCHPGDLGNLSRSCTTLQKSALPKLYHDIQFTCGRGDDLAKLHLFVASILRHPLRARFVRRLQITGAIHSPPSGIETRLAEHDLDLAKRILVPERFLSASGNASPLGLCD